MLGSQAFYRGLRRRLSPTRSSTNSSQRLLVQQLAPQNTRFLYLSPMLYVGYNSLSPTDSLGITIARIAHSLGAEPSGVGSAPVLFLPCEHRVFSRLMFNLAQRVRTDPTIQAFRSVLRPLHRNRERSATDNLTCPCRVLWAASSGLSCIHQRCAVVKSGGHPA